MKLVVNDKGVGSVLEVIVYSAPDCNENCDSICSGVDFDMNLITSDVIKFDNFRAQEDFSSSVSVTGFYAPLIVKVHHTSVHQCQIKLF